MEFTFYYYDPSTAAGAIFVVLFGLSTVLHFYQLIRTRTWFMIPFLIGGIREYLPPSPFETRDSYIFLMCQLKRLDMSAAFSHRWRHPISPRARMSCKVP